LIGKYRGVPLEKGEGQILLLELDNKGCPASFPVGGCLAYHAHKTGETLARVVESSSSGPEAQPPLRKSEG